MDVRCPQCGTTYVFDASRVSEQGVAVQCTECHHTFRIYPPGVQRTWLVDPQDGATVEFKELTALQRWIVEGRLTRHAQISRNGASWRPLGDIKELEPFFAVTEKAALWDDYQSRTPHPAGANGLGGEESISGLREDFLDSESTSSLPVSLVRDMIADADGAPPNEAWKTRPGTELRTSRRSRGHAALSVPDADALAPTGILRPDAEFPSSPHIQALPASQPVPARTWWVPFLVSMGVGLCALALGGAAFLWLAPENASDLLNAWKVPPLPLDPRTP